MEFYHRHVSRATAGDAGVSQSRAGPLPRHIAYDPLKRQDTQYHKGNTYIGSYIFMTFFPFSYNFTGKYLSILSE